MIFFNSYVTAYSTDIASIHYPCFILDTNEIMVIHHEQVKGNISHQLAFILGSIPQLNTFLTLRKKLKKSRDQVTLKKYEHLKAVLTTQGLACNSDANNKLKNFENDFFKKNGGARPDVAAYRSDADAYKLYTKKNA